MPSFNNCSLTLDPTWAKENEIEWIIAEKFNLEPFAMVWNRYDHDPLWHFLQRNALLQRLVLANDDRKPNWARRANDHHEYA